MEHDLVPTQNSMRTSNKACALHLWLCAHYWHTLLTTYGNTYHTVANYVITAIDKIDMLIISNPFQQWMAGVIFGWCLLSAVMMRPSTVYLSQSL